MAKKIKSEVCLQFAGIEVTVSAVTDKIKKVWTDGGNLVKEIDSIDTYVKPEEGMVYYVINRDSEADEVAGSIPIDEIVAPADDGDDK